MYNVGFSSNTNNCYFFLHVWWGNKIALWNENWFFCRQRYKKSKEFRLVFQYGNIFVCLLQYPDNPLSNEYSCFHILNIFQMQLESSLLLRKKKTHYVTTSRRKNRNFLITDISLSSCCITKTLSLVLLVPYSIFTSLVFKGVSNSYLVFFVWKTRNKFARISCVIFQENFCTSFNLITC